MLIQTFDTDRSFVRHTHDCFGFGLIFQGGQRWWNAGRTVEAGAGEAITVNPGDAHDGRGIDGRRRGQIAYVSVEAVTAAATAAGVPTPDRFMVTAPVLGRGRLAAALAALFRAPDDPFERECHIAQMLQIVVADHGGQRIRREPAPMVQTARALIDDDPAAAFSLASLAELVGRSPFQVLRGFAAETGLSPHGYRDQRRVDLACRLIRGGLPLAEVAAAVGYSDQSHLNRAFLRRLGVTPGRWAALQ